jgi:hypothetical protein
MTQIDERESRDEVIQEVRKIKAALAESMGFDIDRILEDARKKQNEGGRTVLSPPVGNDT